VKVSFGTDSLFRDGNSAEKIVGIIKEYFF